MLLGSSITSLPASMATSTMHIVPTLTKGASHQLTILFLSAQLFSLSSAVDAFLWAWKKVDTLCPFPSVYPHFYSSFPCHWFFKHFSSMPCPAGYVIHHCLHVCTCSNLRTLLFWYKIHDKMYCPKLHTLGRYFLIVFWGHPWLRL